MYNIYIYIYIYIYNYIYIICHLDNQAMGVTTPIVISLYRYANIFAYIFRHRSDFESSFRQYLFNLNTLLAN